MRIYRPFFLLRGAPLWALASACLIFGLVATASAQNLAAPITTEAAAAELGIDLSQPLSLDDCIALALRVHPDMRVAASNLQQAIAGVRQSRASLWPGLTISTDYRITEQPTRTAVIGGVVIPVGGGRSTSKNTQLSASFELYRSGRDDQISQAKLYARASREGMADAERQMAYFITQAYYDRLASERLVLVSEASEEAALGHVEMVQARIDANDAASVDIHRVRAQLHATQLELSGVRNQAEIAAAALWSALGEPEAPVTVIDIWADPSALPQLDECVDIAMESRPDLRAMDAQVKASRKSLKLARMQLGPQTMAAGSAEYGRHDGNSGQSWSIYGGVQQSIFDGGSNRAAVQSAKAQLNSTLASADRLNQSVRLGVETAWLNLRRSAEAIAASEASQTEANASLDASETRYGANVGILLEIVDAQSTAASADLSVVRAHYDYNTALAELERAMGIALSETQAVGSD